MKDLWIFGYASLMWYPGVKVEEGHQALLYGGHRALCVKSISYRGTRVRPGVVFGLDAGGACHGYAFRVSAENVRGARAYLKRREMSSYVYREAQKQVKLLDGSGREVRALTYVVNCEHRHYLGKVPYELLAHTVRNSQGRNGRNLDYFLNTVHHMRDLGIYDPHVERICSHLGESWRRSWDDSHTRLVF